MAKKKRRAEKEEQQFIVSQFLIHYYCLCTPSSVSSHSPFCCGLSQVSCSVRDKVNSGQLRVARVKPRRVIYDSEHVSRNPPPPSSLCPPALPLLNPFALRVACMLIVCLLFVVIPNTKEKERSMRV